MVPVPRVSLDMHSVQSENAKSKSPSKVIHFVQNLSIQSAQNALLAHSLTKTESVSWLIHCVHNLTNLQENVKNATQVMHSRKENVKLMFRTLSTIPSVLSSKITSVKDAQQDIISKKTQNVQLPIHYAPLLVKQTAVAWVVSLDTWFNLVFVFQNQKRPETPIAQFSIKTTHASNVQKDLSSIQNYKTVSLPTHCARRLTKMEHVNHASLDTLFQV